MQPLWTVAEIVKATGGRPEGLSDMPISAITIDSREVPPEALFVAINGETHDGHDFVGKALEAGASAALVSEAWFAAHGGQQNVVVVIDPLKALEQLGVAARARSRAMIVAVTGSAGKTTTKEAIRTVLSVAGQTHWSIKSFNNHWGVPLMLAGLPREAQYGVFEIGMNHAGEITPLVKLVRPHVAVITTVAAAHLQFFNSVADIALAKAEIFNGLEPGGTALLNSDHEYLHILFGQAREAGVGRIVTYGFEENSDWWVAGVTQLGDRMAADVRHDGKPYHLRLNVPGRHMVANAVAALAVSQLAGVASKMALDALSGFGAPEGRGLTLNLGPKKKPLLLVDESYNANVASMNAALELYAQAKPPEGRKLVVLGDMLEMGPQGPVLHASLADAVLKAGADHIYLVGPLMRSLADELTRRGERIRDFPGLTHVQSVDDLTGPLLGTLAYGDAVMVKGSKGVRLASLVKSIRERFENA
jgi:UDP-N-acetylmuramoyl-tripeptide--D-alanyl-D-alanine ligase